MPDEPIPTQSNRRPLIAAAVVIALIGAAFSFFWRTTHANDTSFLNDFAGADWIVFPTAYFPSARPALAFDATYRKSFSLASTPHRATLHVRAFRAGSIKINGQTVPLKFDPHDWRAEASIDATAFLQSGQNTISATIENDTGPPALWLRLVTDQVAVQSDSTWETSLAGSAWRSAVSARDRNRPDPDQRVSKSLSPLRGLQATWPWLIFFGVVALAVLTALDRATLSGRSLAWIAFAVCAAAWITLLVHNTNWLPSHVGFDATGHQAYIRFIAERGQLPLPSDGWTMYHPPLYYLINAGLLKLLRFDLQRTSIIHAIRSLNFLIGLANLAFVLGSMRLLFPNRPNHWLIGLTLAAFLPCNLYLHQYPTNEVLVAMLMSAAIYAALRIVIRHEQHWWLFIMLGIALGAAMLTKVSALIPLIVVYATLSIVVAQSRRSIARLATSIVIAGLVCGWHYVRIYKNFGTPFVSNWDPRAGYAWWQDPGFHTSADYFRFGRAFVQPICNIALSVPDTLYATLWGDAQLGGPVAADFRSPWSYDFMCVGYVLAIVPSICVVVGLAVVLVRTFRRIDLAWLMLIAIFGGVVGAIVLLTLRVPHFGSAKAFYALMTLTPFCALAVVGIDSLSFGNRLAWRVIMGLLVVVALNSYASYWVRTSDPAARTVIAARLFDVRDYKRAEALLQSALKADPGHPDARLVLAQYLVERRRLTEARQWLDLAPGQSDSAARHMLIAQSESFAGQSQLARHEVDRAIQLDPQLAHAYLAQGELARQAGDIGTAIDAYRAALALNPYMDVVHQHLAATYEKLGDSENADRHRKYFAMLRSIAPAK